MPTNPKKKILKPQEISGQFINACTKGNLEKVKQILLDYPDMPVNINVIDVLKTVASQSDTRLLAFLLNHKKLKPYFYSSVEDAFREACKKGNLNAVKYLCSSNNLSPFNTPEPSLEDFDNLCPHQISLRDNQSAYESFGFACFYKFKEIVEYILKDLPQKQTISAQKACEAAFCNCIASFEWEENVKLASFILSTIDLKEVELDLTRPQFQENISYLIKEDNVRAFDAFVNPQVLGANISKFGSFVPINLSDESVAYRLLRKCFVSDSHQVFRYLCENSSLAQHLNNEQLNEIVLLALICSSKDIMLYMIENNLGDIVSTPQIKQKIKSSALISQSDIEVALEKKEFDLYFQSQEGLQKQIKKIETRKI